jgi:hypothetical protein
MYTVLIQKQMKQSNITYNISVTITDDSIPKPKGNLKWVIANPQQFGLYRVKYDKRNWNALTDQLVSDHQVNYLAISVVTMHALNVSVKI